MSTPKHSIRRLRVDSPRNSRCGSADLRDLDWSNWWTDDSMDAHYLHVQRNHPEIDGGKPGDETSHRVFCRHCDRPRLRLIDGKLYWLIP